MGWGPATLAGSQTSAGFVTPSFTLHDDGGPQIVAGKERFRSQVPGSPNAMISFKDMVMAHSEKDGESKTVFKAAPGSPGSLEVRLEKNEAGETFLLVAGVPRAGQEQSMVALPFGGLGDNLGLPAAGDIEVRRGSDGRMTLDFVHDDAGGGTPVTITSGRESVDSITYGGTKFADGAEWELEYGLRILQNSR